MQSNTPTISYLRSQKIPSGLNTRNNPRRASSAQGVSVCGRAGEPSNLFIIPGGDNRTAQAHGRLMTRQQGLYVPAPVFR